VKLLTRIILALLRQTGHPAPVSAGARAGRKRKGPDKPTGSKRKVAPTYLTAKQIARFRKNWPDYLWAGRKVGGVPAIAMAGVNWRETGGKREARVYGGAGYKEKGNKRESHIEGGWCQLDMGGNRKTHRARVQKEAERICKLYGVVAGDLDTDFQTGAIVCAHILKTKSRKRPMILNRHVVWANVAWRQWAYNGRSKYHTKTGKPSKELRSWRWSCYVSNDPKRGVRLRIRGTMPNPKGKGRIRINREDKRPGALVISRELA
jgi:hypothetical protein